MRKIFSLSTSSHLWFVEIFFFVLCGAGSEARGEKSSPAPISPQRRSKRPESAGNTGLLELPTVAKRCTFRGSRKCPALRDFVAGRWALATTSLYPSTKIERPQRARNGASWRRSFSALDTTLRGAGSPRFPLPSAAAPYTVQRRRNTINR